MDNATRISLLAAPLLGPALWWLYFYPGRKLRNALWRKLPEGKLRRVLLYNIPGTDETKP